MLRFPKFYAVLLERLLHSPTAKEETMHELKHILVVSRMTKYCKNAVHYGISLSKKCGATLYVLHVMENPFKCCDGWNLSVPALTLAKEYEKLLHKTKKDLDAVINTEKMNGIKFGDSRLNVVLTQPRSSARAAPAPARNSIVAANIHLIAISDLHDPPRPRHRFGGASTISALASYTGSNVHTSDQGSRCEPA